MPKSDDSEWRGLVDQHNRPISSRPLEHQHPNPDSQHDASDKESNPPIGKRAFRFAVGTSELLGLIAIWQCSHGLAVGVAICAIAWDRWPYYSHIGWYPLVASLVAIAFGVLGERVLPTPEVPQTPLTHGWLTAGSAPGIPASERCFSKSSMGLALGSVLTGLLATSSSNEFCAIEMGGRRLLTLKRKGDGLAVSAEIYDPSGLIALIKENEFRSNRLHQPLTMDRSSDQHTLTVRDWLGDISLKVEFLNKELLYVTGKFFVPGYTPILVDDLGVHMVWNRHHLNVCLQTNGGCAISWNETVAPGQHP